MSFDFFNSYTLSSIRLDFFIKFTKKKIFNGRKCRISRSTAASVKKVTNITHSKTLHIWTETNIATGFQFAITHQINNVVYCPPIWKHVCWKRSWRKLYDVLKARMFSEFSLISLYVVLLQLWCSFVHVDYSLVRGRKSFRSLLCNLLTNLYYFYLFFLTMIQIHWLTFLDSILHCSFDNSVMTAKLLWFKINKKVSIN